MDSHLITHALNVIRIAIVELKRILNSIILIIYSYYRAELSNLLKACENLKILKVIENSTLQTTNLDKLVVLYVCLQNDILKLILVTFLY